MSVLIKDIEKPKSCYAIVDGESEYCPFVNTDDDCVLLLKKGICEGTWEEQYSKCPLVEEPERKTGHWVEIGDEPYDEWECDMCGFVIDGSGCIDPEEYRDVYRFCPRCGSDMRGKQDET